MSGRDLRKHGIVKCVGSDYRLTGKFSELMPGPPAGYDDPTPLCREIEHHQHKRGSGVAIKHTGDVRARFVQLSILGQK